MICFKNNEIMKKIFSLSLTASLFGVLFFSSCAKEDNSLAEPSNSDARTKFLGTWYVSENSKDYGASTYNVTTTDSSDASHILLANLYGFSKKTYGDVSGNNVYIPQQIISGSKISGTGTLINNNRINLSYLVQTSTNHYDTVTAVFTK